MSIRSAQEERVLRAARQYGRMKCHGSYIKDGYIVMLNSVDAEVQLKTLQGILLWEAEVLVGTMAADEVDGKLVE